MENSVRELWTGEWVSQKREGLKGRINLYLSEGTSYKTDATIFFGENDEKGAPTIPLVSGRVYACYLGEALIQGEILSKTRNTMEISYRMVVPEDEGMISVKLAL